METVHTHIHADIVDPKDEAETESCGVALRVQLDNEKKIPKIIVGKSAPIEVFFGADIPKAAQIVATTNGQITLSSSAVPILVGAKDPDNPNEEKIYVTFQGSTSASVPLPYSSGWKVIEQVGRAFDLEGKSVSVSPSSPIDGGSASTISTPAFAVFRVSFVSLADIYIFTPQEEGETVIAALGKCFGKRVHASITVTVLDEDEDESSSCCSSSEIETATVVLTYKDFVTGEPISGASVRMDNKSVGITGEGGSVTIEDVSVGEVHKVEASKEGYLSTNSDSLANDQFIIR